MLFFAGASTYRTTSLTTELTCRCHLCTTPFCSLQRAFILGFNLSWSFDGDFYFCFVGWVVLGFWVLGVFFVCFLTYLSYQRGQKGGEKNSKLQNLLCFLGLVSFLKILIRAEGLWLLQLDTIHLQRLQ